MDAIVCLKTRRSVRVYNDTPVPPEAIEAMVDCARLAPTAMNRQPWTFVVVCDAATRTKLAEIVGHAPFITQAPACIAVFCAGTEFWVEDGSAATENLMLAAWARGLGTCWVAGYQVPYAEAVGELLGAPTGQQLLSLVTVGHPAESPVVDKRPLADVIRWERF